MLIDQKRKTIYSSYTGETVNVGDTLDDNETAVIKPAGVTKIIDEYEHKISYKTLASLVGKGATAYDIAYAMEMCIRDRKMTNFWPGALQHTIL